MVPENGSLFWKGPVMRWYLLYFQGKFMVTSDLSGMPMSWDTSEVEIRGPFGSRRQALDYRANLDPEYTDPASEAEDIARQVGL